MRCLFVMLLTFIMPITVKSKRAFLDIILYEVNQDDGRYVMHKTGITGEFSNFGTAGAAEGDIKQMHPHSICEDTDSEDELDYSWVGVIKLPYHPADSCHLIEKARRAVAQGATAVIFDVTDHPDAWKQLNEHSLNSLNQPIVLVEGMDATELMKIIKGKHIARAVIKRGQPSQESFGGKFTDPALLMVCVVVIIVVVALVIRKLRCRKNRQQNSLHEWTMQHTKMKRYRKQRPSFTRDRFASGTISDTSTASGMLCAICIDTFQDGQDLRVLECSHEFHLDCIDAWLKQKRSCPLCNRSFSNLPKEVMRLDPGRHAGEVPPNRSETPTNTSVQLLQRRTQTHENFSEGDRWIETTFRPIAGSQPECVGLYSSLSGDERHSSCSSSDSEPDSDNESCQLLCRDCNSHDESRSHGSVTNYGTHNAREAIGTSHRKHTSRRLCTCAAVSDRLSSRTLLPQSPHRRHGVSAKDYVVASHGKRVKNSIMAHEDDRGLSGSEDSAATDDGATAAAKQCGCPLYNASILAIRGSSAPADSSGLSSATSFASKLVEYSSDSSGSGLPTQNCFQSVRAQTPCIEYSSSDGASNFGWASYTTLEDVLGRIEDGGGGSNCTLADL